MKKLLLSLVAIFGIGFFFNGWAAENDNDNNNQKMDQSMPASTTSTTNTDTAVTTPATTTETTTPSATSSTVTSTPETTTTSTPVTSTSTPSSTSTTTKATVAPTSTTTVNPDQVLINTTGQPVFYSGTLSGDTVIINEEITPVNGYYFINLSGSNKVCYTKKIKKVKISPKQVKVKIVKKTRVLYCYDYDPAIFIIRE